ncbi:unnamed protein product [Moneuplotes crassus]|uniref:Uncharacterized protein n=1 Tax=Euplotes crassus TaxID=5936 RepID=A0AAD2D2U8_EUPCR|nr:unnamed protein product [Moneuplotes crassus]
METSEKESLVEIKYLQKSLLEQEDRLLISLNNIFIADVTMGVLDTTCLTKVAINGEEIYTLNLQDHDNDKNRLYKIKFPNRATFVLNIFPMKKCLDKQIERVLTQLRSGKFKSILIESLCGIQDKILRRMMKPLARILPSVTSNVSFSFMGFTSKQFLTILGNCDNLKMMEFYDSRFEEIPISSWLNKAPIIAKKYPKIRGLYFSYCQLSDGSEWRPSHSVLPSILATISAWTLSQSLESIKVSGKFITLTNLRELLNEAGLQHIECK